MREFNATRPVLEELEKGGFGGSGTEAQGSAPASRDLVTVVAVAVIRSSRHDAACVPLRGKCEWYDLAT